MTSRERSGFIGKEKDAESGLGDFGVRKYDFLAGRFTSPDPLWEKYASLTPYQYCENNPLGSVDVTGMADFIINGGQLLNDGIDDGAAYAVTEEGKQWSLDYPEGDGPPTVNFDRLKDNSYELPSKFTRNQAYKSQMTRYEGEDAGVGGPVDYIKGGRSLGDQITGNSPQGIIRTAHSEYQVQKAIDEMKAQGKGDCIDFYMHNHGWGAKVNATYPQDYEAIQKLNKANDINIKKGIIFHDDQVSVFGAKGEVIMKVSIFLNIGR